jgi:hypothetical protein
LIDGPNCKIPNINPFSKEAMQLFAPDKFTCSSKQPLTSVVINLQTDEATLMIHEDRVTEFLSFGQSDLKARQMEIRKNFAN